MGHWQTYCDETCISKPHTHMAVGGLLGRYAAIKEIAMGLKHWRSEVGMQREIKWAGINGHEFARYQEVGARLLAAMRAGRLHFAAVILESSKLRHRHFNNGCDVLGQSKFICQMIFHQMLPLITHGDTLSIYPDNKTGRAYSAGYGELQGALNNMVLKRYSDYRIRATAVTPICSKSSQIAQLNDILLGAVGYHANSKHLASGGEESPKGRFARWLANELWVNDLSAQTGRHESKCQIWRFKLSEPQ